MVSIIQSQAELRSKRITDIANSIAKNILAQDNLSPSFFLNSIATEFGCSLRYANELFSIALFSVNAKIIEKDGKQIIVRKECNFS